MATDHSSWTQQHQKFEADLNGHSGSLQTLRKTAITDFDRLGYPTTADEAWKSVNLSSLTTPDFQPATSVDIDPATLEPFIYTDQQGLRLVFINGHYSADHSSTSDLPSGVTIDSLAKHHDNPLVQEHLGKVASTSDLAFTALNTAFLFDGAFIHIPRNVILDTPLHLLFITADATTPIASHPRTLVIAESNSQLSLTETFAGLNTAKYLTNSVTEIIAQDNAHIDHVRLELEGDQSLHIANLKANLGRSSNLVSHNFTLGGAFIRNDISAHLIGEGSEATVNGFYVLEDDQHLDNYTLLEHAEPHCPSHELYKGILGGSARAIFRGKIHVHQKAQHTDAYQQNENILLSDNARVNAKPQLEIYADEVKCSHGATIGQLDENALFYLQARGISKPEAKRILLRAFADDVVNRVAYEPTKSHLSELIDAKLDRIYTKDLA